MSNTIRAALDAAEKHATAEVWADHPLAIILEALIKQIRAALAAEPVGEGLEPTHVQVSQWINANPVLRPGSTGGPMIRVGTDWQAAFADAARWGAQFRPAALAPPPHLIRIPCLNLNQSTCRKSWHFTHPGFSACHDDPAALSAQEATQPNQEDSNG